MEFSLSFVQPATPIWNDSSSCLQGIAAALRLGGPPSIGCHKANINGLVAVRRWPEALMPELRGCNAVTRIFPLPVPARHETCCIGCSHAVLPETASQKSLRHAAPSCGGAMCAGSEPHAHPMC